MKMYELGNPSDPYTYYAPDDKLAIAVNLILGNGKTFCIPLDERGQEQGQIGPMLLFASEKQKEDALIEAFGQESLSGFFKNHMAEIADALDSVMVLGGKARLDYEEALSHITDPAKRDEYRAKVHDRHRTSMNNYGSYAWQRAAAIRKQIADEKAGVKEMEI